MNDFKLNKKCHRQCTPADWFGKCVAWGCNRQAMNPALLQEFKKVGGNMEVIASRYECLNYAYQTRQTEHEAEIKALKEKHAAEIRELKTFKALLKTKPSNEKQQGTNPHTT